MIEEGIQSVVFNRGQKMALRALLVVMSKNIYEVKRSQRHVLIALKNNRYVGPIKIWTVLAKITIVFIEVQCAAVNSTTVYFFVWYVDNIMCITYNFETDMWIKHDNSMLPNTLVSWRLILTHTKNYER